MEEKLQEKELEILSEEFESLSEYIQELWQFLPLPIFNLTHQGVIIETNQAFAGLSLWSLDEIIGKPLNVFFQPKEAQEIISQTLAKKSLAGRESVLMTKKNEKIAVAIYSRVREDKEKNVLGLFMAAIDIREEKKFQEELEKRVREKTKELLDKTKELESSEKALMNILEDIEEARYGLEEEKNKTLSIITNFTDGLLFFDKENRLALTNPQAEIFFAIASKDILGKTVQELTSTPNIGPVLIRAGTEIKGITKNEVSIRNGLILELTTIPVIQEDKKIGTMIILHDITREKLVEKMKTEFVSLAAHQLRTPLSAIKWTMKMLLDGDLGGITKEQQTFIQKVYASNERMIHLINDLLNVTRIEEGRFLFKLTSAQITEIITLAISNLKEKADRKNIKIIFLQPKKSPPFAVMDTEKIEIAITNIIDNAIDYTPENGKVTVVLSTDQNGINFSVRDNGVGIPQNQQKRIFTKFFRGENVIKMETEGTGLGMFITKNIIDTHGGKIWFESKEGQGTIFSFILPFVTPMTLPPA